MVVVHLPPALRRRWPSGKRKRGEHEEQQESTSHGYTHYCRKRGGGRLQQHSPVQAKPSLLYPIGYNRSISKAGSYASVWDAIADTPGQAANLRARAELMRQIAALMKRRGWTQAEAAQRCGVTQPRINDLLRGRVSRFSLDALVNISAALGRRVRVDLETA